MTDIKPTLALAERLAANRDQDDIRARIIGEAIELFAHYGYSKTNIGDIAQACSMSPGNLYRYFRNKQAIGHAVVECYFQAEGDLVAEVLAEPGSAEDKVRRMISAMVMHTVEELRRSPKIVELAEMICETEEGIALVGGQVQDRAKHLAAIIQHGIDTGEFQVKDAGKAARAVQMGTKFFVVPFAIARHGLDQVEDDLALTLDLLCAGLRAGGA